MQKIGQATPSPFSLLLLALPPTLACHHHGTPKLLPPTEALLEKYFQIFLNLVTISFSPFILFVGNCIQLPMIFQNVHSKDEAHCTHTPFLSSLFHSSTPFGCCHWATFLAPSLCISFRMLGRSYRKPSAALTPVAFPGCLACHFCISFYNNWGSCRGDISPTNQLSRVGGCMKN